MEHKTKLSILVCWGPGREAFWPWLAWNIGKQQGLDWSRVEVLIDAPPSASADLFRRFFLPPGCTLVRLVSPENELVPVKRNRLMSAARGEYLCWMDSDDWQSPTRLRYGIGRLEQSLERGFAACDYVAHAGLRYLDIHSMLWCELPLYSQLAVPITTIGRATALRSISFTEDRPRGTDTIWHRMLGEHLPERGVTIHQGAPHFDRKVYFFALYHEGNMTPHIAWFRYERPLSALRELCGTEWGETTEQLRALCARLKENKP